jgi:pyruvate dehydrogenase E1 component alpha subunit
LNLCAIWNLPAIFVLENNRYASTTSTAETMKITDVARRADGYGIPATIVDGFDAFAVFAALEDAVARARDGGGPTFIECKTYRARGHFIGDPERYRRKGEVEDVMSASDPIVRMQGMLGEALAPDDFERIWVEARDELADAVAFARASAAPEPQEAFFGVYARDREPGDPVHRIEARERDALLPFAPRVGSGSQGSGH